MILLKTNYGEKMEETVDILVATYKPNIVYLKQQIDSILNQTYKKIQIIISDDCSEDKNVIEVLKQYQKQDKRISVYLQEKNLGYIKNFEFLLKQSKANYIAFCDQDDIWDVNKIEKSLQTLKEKDVDLIYCNARHINEKNEIIHQNYFQYKNMPLVKGKNNILAISRYLGLGCSQLFTADVRDKMLPYTASVMAHDWLASFIANEGKGVAYIEEPLFSYRLHTENVFGGRSLQQNITRWKQEHGKSYKSYLQYRNENVIDKAYLDGAKMCLEYAKNSQTREMTEKLVKYYETLKKSRFFNFHIIQYVKFLGGKNMFKKMLKEMIIFHMPLFGYLIYCL